MKSAFAIVLATIFVAFVSATPPPKCPEDNGEDVVLLPNLDDCTTYYSCNGGVAFLMECNHGLHYNAELRVCDYPESANCLEHRTSPHSRPSSPRPRPSSLRPRPSSPRPRPSSPRPSPSLPCTSPN